MKTQVFPAFLFAALISLLFPPHAAGRAFGSDNIVASDRSVDCELVVRDGKVTGARVRSEIVYEAQRGEGSGLQLTFYDEQSPVTKASAPGGKPVYRAWEPGDLFFTGSRVCALPFTVRPGKQTRVTVEQNFMSAELISPLILNCDRYDARHVRLSVRIPAEVAERVAVHRLNMPAGAVVTESADSKGNVTVSVEATDVAAFAGEKMSPSYIACVPMLLVNASFGSVDEVYAHLRSLTEDDSDDSAVAAVARAVTDTLTTDIDRANAIAAWVRENIRYVAIEHGEFAHRPDSPSGVLAKRYGDCKGSANLMRAMLRAVGIDGRLVWIGTRDDVPADWSVNPAMSAANHMIAAAVLPDTVLFLDGTARHAPRGYIPFPIAGRECLMQDGDHGRLVTVPPYDAGATVLRHRGTYAIDGNTLTGEAVFEFGGGWRAALESTVNSITASRREQTLNSILSGRRRDMRFSGTTHTTAAADAPVSLVTATVTDPAAVKPVAGRDKLYVQPRLLRLLPVETVDDTDRRLPLAVGIPLSVAADITVAVPEGYEAANLPLQVDIDNEWFEGSVSYSLTDDGTAVRCTGRVGHRRLEGDATQAASWNAAVREVERAGNSPIIFTRKQ